ncbi:hypothetical protein JK361_30175 [Streptomyces sp. 5-8]|uniref:SMI1/KNR4 family protein n=1 Tax=Streptomyces musisoli TaxID=2802280 RepID=A0ABS1P9S2_9ACTN|nr:MULTISPECIES: hypothetical protein [Streptomyces]MBL1108802.1 hypothetical protein [Streptomyces musisoli]MBY8842930.1 hypothetical protein [Streptomyces sp. SP2-10]
MSPIDRLLEISSPALADEVGQAGGSLGELLRRRNGFYAFLGALHVYPTVSGGDEISQSDWNSEDLWKGQYPGLGQEYTAFAEDLFGGQFLYSESGVFQLDPETGEIEEISTDIEGWCAAILEEPEILTGYPLAEEWQELHGQLPAGKRLAPRKPFVLGGEFACDNLMLVNTVESLRWRAELAAKIRDVPDGGQIVLRYE